MGVFRRIVMPVLWLFVGLVVAAALAKLAFFTGPDAPSDDERPTADISASTVTVERGEITSAQTLNGTVERDTGTAITAPQSGEVNYLWVKPDQKVKQGDKLFQIRVPQEQEPKTSDGDGAPNDSTSGGDKAQSVAVSTQPVAPSATTYRYYDVKAPAGGTLSTFSIKLGQQVEAGQAYGEVSPATFSLAVDLTPEQQLDFITNTDVKVTATLPRVDKPFECSGAKIKEKTKDEAGTTKDASTAADPMTGEEITDTSQSFARLMCKVPDGTVTVPGLAGTVDVDTGTATDVLVVPATAVSTGADGSTVSVLDEGSGGETSVPVVVGRTDGSMVEIKEGLEEGQEILQFAPGVPGDDGDAQWGVDVW